MRHVRFSIVSGATLVLAACAAACASEAEQGNLEPATAAKVAPAHALVAIQTRDHKVTWVTGQTVRVEDAHGIVADNVSVEALKAIDPFLYEAATNATAKTYLDATFHVHNQVVNDDPASPASPRH